MHIMADHVATSSSAPLEGIRVLDLTNVLAGPFCCHQLAHMGTDVIKVEVPGSGDLARQLGADPELNAKYMGVSFLAQNSGKRSITINMKSEAGKTAFKRLVATADVLVENFRPGVMERLGVGYDVLKKIKPELIHCELLPRASIYLLRQFCCWQPASPRRLECSRVRPKRLNPRPE